MLCIAAACAVQVASTTLQTLSAAASHSPALLLPPALADTAQAQQVWVASRQLWAIPLEVQHAACL
jgi:hypothetical protein